MIISFSVEMKHRLSRNPRRLKQTLKTYLEVQLVLLNLSATETREDVVSNCDRHLCLSPHHSPTLSQWVFLSLSLHLPNDMWVAVYFCLHLYAQDSTARRKSFCLQKRRSLF